jgi:TonB family protein
MDTAKNWPHNAVDTIVDDPKIFTVVENMPSFPGGNDSLFKFISDNIKYPKEAIKNKISGKVFVTFVVSNTGKVTEAKIMRGIGGGCDEEALRIFSIMPDWIPGTQNGKKVNVAYSLPVHFVLNKQD